MMLSILKRFVSLPCLILLVGCGSGGGGGGALSCSEDTKRTSRALQRFTPDLSADGRCLTFVEGPPIGISCLHCLQPEARSQALHLAELMAASCRRNLATFVLADGSFGTDQEFLQELIRRMTRTGSSLYLYLYFGNGPWQRDLLSSPQRGFPSGIGPEEFRLRIQSEGSLQEQYRELIRHFEPAMRFAADSGVSVHVLPMLEDNLDAPSARVMEQLVRESVSPSIPYRLGRNPCPGCFPGNDVSVPTELFADQHVSSSCHRVSVAGGLSSNDGGDFYFPDEPNVADLEFEELFAFAEEAAARGTTFVLWKGDFQGRPQSADVLDPAVRSYVFPTADQDQHLLDFLQTMY